MWGKSHKGRTIQVIAAAAKKKVIYFHYRKHTRGPSEQRQVCPSKSCSNLHRDDCARSENTHVCTILHAHTNTYSLSGWPSWELQEVSPVWVSCPPLWSLPPFPGNWGQSPHTHTQTPTHPQSTHPHFPLCCCCCLLHAHTPPTAVVHSYSLHPPFSFSFLCDSPQKVEVTEDAKGAFSLSSLSPFHPLPHLIFFCMSKTDRWPQVELIQ